MNILQYLAGECDNDELVIEESLRESYYNYVDVLAESVMKQGLEKVSVLINSGGLQE